MTPLPGSPPGNAHPGRPSVARHCLVALLLAVLALVVGAPAAAGAGLPVRATATTPAPPAAEPAVRQATAEPTATGAPRTASPAAAVPPPATVDRGSDPAPPVAAPVPRTASPAAAVPPPATVERGPDTTPWAAAEHPRTAHQLPPPGPGLVPCPVRVPLPRSVPWSVRTAPVHAAQRPSVALPGVRGPPSAGVHRPGDRFPVPRSSNAVPFPPS